MKRLIAVTALVALMTPGCAEARTRLSGAGADRFSTGMKKSFGKPIGQAARVKKGETICQVDVDKKNLEVAKKAMHRASMKMACPCTVTVENRKI